MLLWSLVGRRAGGGGASGNVGSSNPSTFGAVRGRAFRIQFSPGAGVVVGGWSWAGWMDWVAVGVGGKHKP